MDHLSSGNYWFSEDEMDYFAAFVNDEQGGTLEDIVQFCLNNNNTNNNNYDPKLFDQTTTQSCNNSSPSTCSSSYSFWKPSDYNGGGGIMFQNNPEASSSVSKTKTTADYKEEEMIAMDEDYDENSATIISFGSSSQPSIEFGAAKVGHTRSPLQAQYHVSAERMRRNRLTQRFMALSSLIPNLKKLSKATVLEEAGKYIKELEERVRTLEEALEHMTKKHGYNNVELPNVLPDIRVGALGDNLLIRVHCNEVHSNNHSVVIKEIIKGIEKLNLIVTNSHAMPFGKTTFMTITAQMDHGFRMETKDIAHKIRIIIGKLKCNGSTIHELA